MSHNMTILTSNDKTMIQKFESTIGENFSKVAAKNSIEKQQ